MAHSPPLLCLLATLCAIGEMAAPPKLKPRAVFGYGGFSYTDTELAFTPTGTPCSGPSGRPVPR